MSEFLTEILIEAIGGIGEPLLDDCASFVSSRRRTHRRRRVTKIIALAAAIIAGAAVLTGAAAALLRVTFPNSFANRTEHSAAIYDIEPFKMSIFLPAGCVMERSAGEGGWSPMDILLDGEKVGTADYSTFELYDGVDRSDPGFYRMVYNQLMLGAQANWGIDYTVVKQDEASENAVTKIGVISDYGNGRTDNEVTYLPGVLAFNTDLLVYVNISFEDGAFTDEQIEDIARSISLTR